MCAAENLELFFQAGWGDDADSESALNKYYSVERYQAYRLGTRRNLSRLNEHVIDYELLEDLVNFHCETEEEGAVLVFLPGEFCLFCCAETLCKCEGKLIDAIRWLHWEM